MSIKAHGIIYQDYPSNGRWIIELKAKGIGDFINLLQEGINGNKIINPFADQITRIKTCIILFM
jgi:hypothetical protein